MDKKDRKEFDHMYDCVKLQNAACSNACKYVVIHAVLMSVIFALFTLLATNKINGSTKSERYEANVQYTVFVDIGKAKGKLTLSY